MSSYREIIAKNVAPMIHDGDFVNLGVGIPSLVSNYIPKEKVVILHGENGSAGLAGRLPLEGIFDDADTFLRWEREHSGEQSDYRTGHKDLTDAGSDPAILMPGACNFDICMSFTMSRGGHLNMTVLGAMQVDQEGNLANWMIPGSLVTGMGGAMDIISGTKKVVVATKMQAKDGSPKLLTRCTLPFTALGRVTTVVTEKCITEIKDGRFVVISMYPGVTRAELQRCSGAELLFADSVDTMLP